MTYSKPPMGALNAAATPAALPNCKICLRSSGEGCHPRRARQGTKLSTVDAAHAPMCTEGPSLPKGMVAVITRHIPTERPTNVRQWNRPRCRLPFRYPLSSGMPLPRAMGATRNTYAAVAPTHSAAHPA